MSPTSIHHPFLKDIRRAAASGRPTPDGLIVAEGPHLVAEARASPWTVEYIVVTEAALARHSSLLQGIQAEVLTLPARTFAQLSGTESNQGILGLLRPRTYQWTDLLQAPALVVVLDAIQDPGNAGAIARSAEAFGATGLVLLEGSVHAANGKFLRASAGSLFRLPYVERVRAGDTIGQLQAAGIAPYILAPKASRSLANAGFRGPSALIVGNEGSGVSPELLSAGMAIMIPTQRVESLNAAIACALALYQAHSQRLS